MVISNFIYLSKNNFGLFKVKIDPIYLLLGLGTSPLKNKYVLFMNSLVLLSEMVNKIQYCLKILTKQSNLKVHLAALLRHG